MFNNLFCNSLFHIEKSKRILFYLIIGGLTALSFPPFFIIPIFILSNGFLYFSTWKESRHVLSNSFFYFTGFFIALLYWLVNPLTFDLKQYFILIPFAILLAPMFLAIQFASSIYIMKKYFWGKSISRILSFSCSITLLLIFISEVFPNFPWMLPAYTCCGHEIFMQTIWIYGVYGLSFMLLLLSALCGEFFISLYNHKKTTPFLFSIVIISFVLLGYGYYRLSKNQTSFTGISAELVQCNISQKDKENKTLLYKNLEKQLIYSQHKEYTDFIIWGEASIPYLYYESFKDLHQILTTALHDNEILITGAVRKDMKTSLYYNSIVAINHFGKNIAIYDKSKLVPFGEYIPCRKLLSISALASNISDFAIGTTPKIQKIKGLNILFSNCYEAVFRQKRQNADVMINLTNDGWFGNTSELFQHLAIVRARSVELGIPVIRVTNFGVTAVFDACGRLIAKIPAGKAQSIRIKIPQKL